MQQTISSPSKELLTQIQSIINNKTKPVGSLGILETIAERIALILQTTKPAITKPSIAVFAADHGITQEGVSLYPKEVTRQMVLNFLRGGAAINVFARQHGLNLYVIDAGVDCDFLPEEKKHPNFIDAKIVKGSSNFKVQPALTEKDCRASMEKGAAIIQSIHRDGCNLIGPGEMGIGNTTPATALIASLCDLDVKDVAGRGTGITDVSHKVKVIEEAFAFHGRKKDPFSALSTFGGVEIAMMCGAYLEAASKKMIILVDGFIATAAFLTAWKMQPAVKEYAFFSHLSGEGGHLRALQAMDAKPILTLDMRLGEGTGAAVVFPIIQSAVAFLNEMASFEEASVSKNHEK